MYVIKQCLSKTYALSPDLIPELCTKLTFPARCVQEYDWVSRKIWASYSTFRTALLLPSILRRIDDLLLVKEMNAKYFDHSIDEHQLHAALSTPSAGMEFDYERLELLGKFSHEVIIFWNLKAAGDAYLKYLSSIYLFVTNPTKREGDLHIARQRIISNQSLLKNADRSGLPQFIQSRPFNAKVWVPPNWILSCSPRKPEENQPVNISMTDHINAIRSNWDTERRDIGVDKHVDLISKTVLIAENSLTSFDKKDSKISTSSKALRYTQKNTAMNDDGIQWLGDKVIPWLYILFDYDTNLTGHSWCCWGYYWSSFFDRRAWGCLKGCKVFKCTSTSYWSVGRL